jgi:hypothetical protein
MSFRDWGDEGQIVATMTYNGKVRAGELGGSRKKGKDGSRQ